MRTNVLTPFPCGSFTKLFSKDRANKYFAKGMVVFFAGGARMEAVISTTCRFLAITSSMLTSSYFFASGAGRFSFPECQERYGKKWTREYVFMMTR